MLILRSHCVSTVPVGYSSYYPDSLYTKKCIFDYHKKNMKYLYKCIDGINNLSFLDTFLLTTFG